MKIALIGEQCSGKSSVAEIIKNYLAPIVVKFADPIYATLEAINMPKNRLFMQEFSDLGKKHFGDDLFVRLFIDSVKRIEAKRYLLAPDIVCDDVRYPIQLQACRDLDFTIIYVEAEESVRIERSKAQGLVFNSEHSSEQHVKSMKPMADIVIKNSSGDLETLHKDVLDALVKHKLVTLN